MDSLIMTLKIKNDFGWKFTGNYDWDKKSYYSCYITPPKKHGFKSRIWDNYHWIFNNFYLFLITGDETHLKLPQDEDVLDWCGQVYNDELDSIIELIERAKQLGWDRL